jgi:transcriptional regulator with XRE-family HTH domain
VERTHLIKRRKQLGLSQAEIANRMGTTQNHVSRLEKGVRRLTPELAKRLAKALECSPEWVAFPEGNTALEGDRLPELQSAQDDEALRLKLLEYVMQNPESGGESVFKQADRLFRWVKTGEVRE